jgi:hypothetical protein
MFGKSCNANIATRVLVANVPEVWGATIAVNRDFQPSSGKVSGLFSDIFLFVLSDRMCLPELTGPSLSPFLFLPEPLPYLLPKPDAQTRREFAYRPAPP